MPIIFSTQIFLGAFLTLFVYGLYSLIHLKTKSVWTNPMVLSMLSIPFFLMAQDISFEKYQIGAGLISYFIGPATIALAVPMARQFQLLKQYASTILFGITVGSIVAFIGNFLCALILGLPKELVLAVTPKSVTTPIAIEVAHVIGGDPVLTTGMVVATGILGMLMARSLLTWFHIEDPISRGLAMGVSFHAIGIVRAREEGEFTGAISSISIALAGVITTIAAPLLFPFLKYWL
ncbi:LrgB family protein [Ammoniphilus resinae]|uniref:Murein hydrolase (TIGR00659 family) n=1 Tax=Ammoniphilus resinae TaxID=861532 RepID=A0ABS4GIZ4_9BACL|nr:LrgB family protein [Ammoniphilus resinae]MBP1930230.1 putative murein hydrolase (TIGR00659 family) [Ammoniphilus resinae]